MKKILATVSAVVLSLAMVAMPSVAMADEVESTEPATTEVVATESAVVEPAAEEPVAEPAATEPTEVATTQGAVAISRSTTARPTSLLCTDITGGLGYEAKVDVDANDPVTVSIPSGFTLVAYCVKAGTEPIIIDSNDDAPGDGTLPFVGPGDFVIDHPNKDSVSHYQLKLVATQPTPVTPDATFVDEVCEEEEDVLVPGVITVDLSVVGVTYSITQGGNPVAFDAVTGETGPLTSGLTYIVTATANPGYVLSGPYEEQFTPTDNSEGCGEVATSVTPDATFVDEVCEEEEDVLVPGVITVDLSVVGVTYSITQGGNPVAFDAVTGETGPLTSGLTYIVTATANPGYVLSGPYEEQFTPTDNSEGCGEVATSVTPDATFVDESCNVQTKDVTPGVITVDLSVVGVTYSITQGGNPVAFDAVTGETGPLTSGLTYIVTATASPGYVLSGPYEEQFTPTSAAIDCETLPLVVPQASQVSGCELPSSFTIGNDLSDPAALSWTANGDPIAEGTHVVNAPATIILVATANGPEYGIADGIQREWTFTFPSDGTCGDLDTLALTGSSHTTPALALTAFLGLLGLAMVRSGIRVNNNRQEA